MMNSTGNSTGTINAGTVNPGTGTATGQRSGTMAGWIGMARRMAGSVATRGRIIAMSVVGVLGIIVGVVVDRANPGDEVIPPEFLSRFGLTIFVPLVSLVVASATLGNLREERTMAYFWLRPIGRWQITIAAYVSGLAVLLPLVLVPLVLLGGAIGDAADVRGILVGAALGAIGYAGIFTFLGLVTQRALAWGLVYILVWEGWIAELSKTAGRFALRTYSTSALGEIADVDLVDASVSVATAAIVTLAVAVVCFALTTWQLNRMDVD